MSYLKRSLIISFSLLLFSKLTFAKDEWDEDFKEAERFRKYLLGHYFTPFIGSSDMPKKSSLFKAEQKFQGFQLRPLYSHSYVKHNGKEYSVWIVRPVLWKSTNGATRNSPSSAYVRDPTKAYSSDRKIMFGEIPFENPKTEKAFWDEHEAQTKTLMGHFRNAIGEVYREQGYFDTPEKAEKQEKIFDRIFDGYSSIMAVTEKDNPSKVYQQVAVVINEGDGLPIDHELEELGAKRLDVDPIKVRCFPLLPHSRDNNISPTQPVKIKNKKGQEMELKQNWVSGEKVEIKALMKAKDSPEDFLGLLLNQSIKNRLMDSSLVEIPPLLMNRPQASLEQVAFYEWTYHPIAYENFGPYNPDRVDVAVQHGYTWLAQPLIDQTVRNTRVYVSTHSKSIERLYVSGLGFDPNPVRVVQDQNGHEMKVLTTEIAKLETETYKRALQRSTSKWLEDAVLTPAQSDIYGKTRPYVQLESFAEGERRGILKAIAPQAEALIARYHKDVFKDAQNKSHLWVKSAQERTRNYGVDVSALEYRHSKATLDASKANFDPRDKSARSIERFQDSLPLPDSEVHAAYDAANPKITLENINHLHPELEKQIRKKWLNFSGEVTGNPPTRFKINSFVFEKVGPGDSHFDANDIHFKMEIELPENIKSSEMKKILHHGRVHVDFAGMSPDGPNQSSLYTRSVRMKITRCEGKKCWIIPEKGDERLKRLRYPNPNYFYWGQEFNGADPDSEKLLSVYIGRPYANDRTKGYYAWPERSRNPIGDCDKALSALSQVKN